MRCVGYRQAWEALDGAWPMQELRDRLLMPALLLVYEAQVVVHEGEVASFLEHGPKRRLRLGQLSGAERPHAIFEGCAQCVGKLLRGAEARPRQRKRRGEEGTA